MAVRVFIASLQASQGTSQKGSVVDVHLYVHISAGLDEGFHNSQVTGRCSCMQSSRATSRSHTRLC